MVVFVLSVVILSMSHSIYSRMTIRHKGLHQVLNQTKPKKQTVQILCQMKTFMLETLYYYSVLLREMVSITMCLYQSLHLYPAWCKLGMWLL